MKFNRNSSKKPKRAILLFLCDFTSIQSFMSVNTIFKNCSISRLGLLVYKNESTLCKTGRMTAIKSVCTFFEGNVSKSLASVLQIVRNRDNRSLLSIEKLSQKISGETSEQNSSVIICVRCFKLLF